MFQIEWRIADARTSASATRVNRGPSLAGQHRAGGGRFQLRPMRNRGGDERGDDRMRTVRQARALRLEGGADEERMAVEFEPARLAGLVLGRDPERSALELHALARVETEPAVIALDQRRGPAHPREP